MQFVAALLASPSELLLLLPLVVTHCPVILLLLISFFVIIITCYFPRLCTCFFCYILVFSGSNEFAAMNSSDKINSTGPTYASVHTTVLILEPTMLQHREWEHVILAGSLVLILLATLLGNVLLCIAVHRRHKLRTRTNMFVANLACADIGVALLCMPFSLITCLNDAWVFGDTMCKLNGFLNIVFTQTSLLTLTAISIETYYAIVKPLYHRLMGKKRFVWLLAWTWIQPTLLALVPFTGLMPYEFKTGEELTTQQI